MNIKNLTKEEALQRIEELQKYIENQNANDDWVTIDYSIIRKELFKKYGVKPFQIMKKKMRNAAGGVWHSIDFFEAKAGAEKRGLRLPNIREILLLLEAYKEQNVFSVYDNDFLGIEELSYNEDVCYEWVEALNDAAFLRGGTWSNGTNAGVFTLYLYSAPLNSGTNLGFRCARDLA